jgi:hypothetical protein
LLDFKQNVDLNGQYKERNNSSYEFHCVIILITFSLKPISFILNFFNHQDKFTIKTILCKIWAMEQPKHRRNKLERKLDEYNHTMSFIRTVIPIIILILQLIILFKLM